LKPTFYYRIYRSRHLSLSWARSIHSMPLHPTSSRYILIPGSTKCSLSLRFPHQNPVDTNPLAHICYMPRPSHSSQFDQLNNIWWAVQIIKPSLCNCLYSPVNSSIFDPHILLSTLTLKHPLLTFTIKCYLKNVVTATKWYQHLWITETVTTIHCQCRMSVMYKNWENTSHEIHNNLKTMEVHF